MKKIVKYHVPYILSILAHLLILLYIFNFQAKSENEKKEFAVVINLSSNSDNREVTNEKQILKKSSNSKIIKKTEIKDHNTKKSDQKNQKEITDLSYNNNTYNLGSSQNPIPPYPRIAKIRNYTGNVEISILSDSNGKVINAKIHKSSGYPILDKSALFTLRTWQFNIKKPQNNNNKYYRIIVPINFVL